LTLPLGAVTSRADADRRLAAAIPSAPIVAMSCKTCAATASTGSGAATSKASQRPLHEIRGFPDPAGRQFAGPALFLYGTNSDYVNAQSLPAIRRLFPLARLRAIANAGHWVYADQPDAFIGALEGFLDKL
jgi:esterase